MRSRMTEPRKRACGGEPAMGVRAPMRRRREGAPLLATGLTANAQTNLEFSSGTILRPQLEPGAHATDFERRPPSVEFELCQRYFTILSVGWAGIATAIYQFSGEYSVSRAHARDAHRELADCASLYNVDSEYVDIMSATGFRYLIRSAGGGPFTSANSTITFSAEI